MTARKREPLVRYCSPYGTPAWMAPADAERHLAEDDARWMDDQQYGLLSEWQKRHGPPRIERHTAR